MAISNFRWIACLALLLPLMHPSRCRGQVVHEFMDLQIHTTMHAAYCFFGKGLRYFPEDDPPKLKYKHQFRNVNYANFLDDGYVRILVNGAILPEYICSRKRARRLILKQINYVNDFVAAHPDRFAVAKSPEEVRALIDTTDKVIFLHSVEGAKRLVNSAEDAEFWADRGVAYMTLIHLVDDEYGGAAIKPGFINGVINYKGTLRRWFCKKKDKGLTEKGRLAIRRLANAGIMTDITHMSPQTREDALDVMEAHGIPPLATHEMYQPIQNHVRGLSQADIVRIYRNGGLLALPISGTSLEAYKPFPAYQRLLDSLPNYCSGSVDTYKLTYQAVNNFLQQAAGRILGDSTLQFADLTEAQKIQLALGYQSDFNGWLNHSRPRYGRKGCLEPSPDQTYEEIETKGLAHPGLVASQWRLLEEEDVDLAPIKRASERFLQLWEYFLAHRGEF